MRVGIVARSLVEKGGVGVYTRNIIHELLSVDQKNDYVLFHQSGSTLGQFSNFPNVSEKLIKAPNKVFFDQVSIPYACWKEKVDVLFHPKFTVPLLATCKTVMVLHGAGWFMPEFMNFWKGSDLKYAQIMMPIFCKKASAIISVSQVTTDVFNQVFNIQAGKIRTIYFGPAKHFRRVIDQTTLANVRKRYNLPEKFIFTLTKPKGDSRKNLGQILQAYGKYHEQTVSPYPLVIGGTDASLYRSEYSIPDHGYGQDILFPGWIEQEDMPAVYTLAGIFLYPSRLEAFPIPITEAMACGTPIITSNTNGLIEIAGDAGYLVNPDNSDEIAAAIHWILSDSDLQRQLSERGLERAKQYKWEKCATETLETLASLV